MRSQTMNRPLLAASLSLICGLGLAQGAPESAAVKSPRPLASKPAPEQATSLPGLTCNGEVASPGKLTLAIGKSTLLRLPEAVTNRTLGNPSIAQAMLVSPETLYLLGVEVGTTNMILQGKSGKCSAVDVVVTMDPGALQATYKELMPEEADIRVSAAADSLVLSGSVTDSVAAMRAVDLATAFVRRPAVMNSAGQQQNISGATVGGNQMQMTAGMTGINTPQSRIVNLLVVSAAQQVILEVKIAEVSKTLLDKLGIGVNGIATSGPWSLNLASQFLTGTLAGKLTLANGNKSIALEAEKKDGLIKILAEPSVMAISGQEGSFLAGGKILIPVSQTSLAGGIQVTLEEKEFGVGLKFTPTVLAGGRINLRVAPEVSELSREGVGITAAGGNNPAILPLITTRRASTTVQLVDGQSFAIGGLIKNNTTANIKAFPILGELPIIGALFRSTDFQQDRTELLFVVTPHLVKPLPVGYKLPTDNYKEPGRSELFIGGQLEGGKDSKDNKDNGKQQDGAAGFELK